MILKDKYPTKKIFLYTGMTDDDLKKEHFKNVSKYWAEADIIIYSPTVESGVNFNMEHINSIYGIFSTCSCSQRSFFQMLARTRQTKNNNILIYSSSIPEKTSADFWTFKDVKEAKVALRGQQKKEIDENGKIKTLFDNYDINDIYNEVEDKNKNKCYFMALFYQMALNKGHTILFEEEQTPEQKTKKQIKEANENDKYLDISKMDTVIKYINDANDVSLNQYFNLIDKSKKNKSTEEEKYQMAKFELKTRLGFDKIEAEQIETFYNKTHFIYNFIGLIDINNINEDKENNVARVKIANNILYDLGFKNVFDEKKIDFETFNKALLNLQTNNIIYKDFKHVKSYFNMAKEPKENRTKTNRAIIDYINILLKNFSIKITGKIKPGKKNETKNMVYYIDILNNVQEIVEYLKLKGVEVEDKQQIFKPLEDNKKIYKHLIIIDDKPEEDIYKNMKDNDINNTLIFKHLSKIGLKINRIDYRIRF
jgi:hypothetical protein